MLHRSQVTVIRFTGRHPRAPVSGETALNRPPPPASPSTTLIASAAPSTARFDVLGDASILTHSGTGLRHRYTLKNETLATHLARQKVAFQTRNKPRRAYTTHRRLQEDRRHSRQTAAVAREQEGTPRCSSALQDCGTHAGPVVVYAVAVYAAACDVPFATDGTGERRSSPRTLCIERHAKRPIHDKRLINTFGFAEELRQSYTKG